MKKILGLLTTLVFATTIMGCNLDEDKASSCENVVKGKAKYVFLFVGDGMASP